MSPTYVLAGLLLAGAVLLWLLAAVVGALDAHLEVARDV